VKKRTLSMGENGGGQFGCEEKKSGPCEEGRKKEKKRGQRACNPEKGKTTYQAKSVQGLITFCSRLQTFIKGNHPNGMWKNTKKQGLLVESGGRGCGTNKQAQRVPMVFMKTHFPLY